jgi:hypothetical protein
MTKFKIKINPEDRQKWAKYLYVKNISYESRQYNPDESFQYFYVNDKILFHSSDIYFNFIDSMDYKEMTLTELTEEGQISKPYLRGTESSSNSIIIKRPKVIHLSTKID